MTRFSINEVIKLDMELENARRLSEIIWRESAFGFIYDLNVKRIGRRAKLTRQQRRHLIRKAGMR